MIKSFTVGYFKAFRDPQTINIKPITLIFGPNSSGKSSLIHSMLFLNHFLETGEVDVHETVLGGNAVDLGGFHHFTYRGERRDYEKHFTSFELQLPWTERLGGYTLEKPAEVLVHLNFGHELGHRTKNLKNYSFDIDGSRLMSLDLINCWPEAPLAQNPFLYRVSDFDFTHPLAKHVVDEVVKSSSRMKRPKSTVKDCIANLYFNGPYLPGGFDLVGEESNRDGGFNYSEVGSSTLRDILHITSDLNTRVRTEFRTLKYLGPLRSYLSRHWASSPKRNYSDVVSETEAWQAVLTSQSTRDSVNNWLKQHTSTPYAFEIDSLVSLKDVHTEMKAYINDYSSDEEPGQEFPELKFRLEHAVQSGYIGSSKSVMLRDSHTGVEVSHRDIGIGISQMLPILIQAFHAKEHVIAIEQPEVHLHPALQAELGDLFIETALNGPRNSYVIETHSEHLILRLLRRIRETTNGSLPEGLPPVSPADVSVLYVRPGENGSRVMPLEIDEEGQFLDPWPGGFFEEGFRERFS